MVVNADDFGFTRDVNEGIIACHQQGILTATTLMATGAAFRHAVELAKSNPTLDMGCHLVLVQEPGFPRNVSALLQALYKKRIDPHREFARQVNIILKAGLRPTHLDTHKHTHLIPMVLDAVLRVSEEYTIPWIRRPVDFARDSDAPFAKQAITRAMKLAVQGFDRKLAKVDGRRTDSFTGFQLTGRLAVRTLADTLTALPDGITELMCHPGYLRDDLAQAGTRLKKSRADELDALCHPDIRAMLTRSGIQLASYRDL